MFLMWIIPLALIVLVVYAVSGGNLANAFKPPAKLVVQGRTYYFCSELCKRLFEREPRKYIEAVKE